MSDAMIERLALCNEVLADMTFAEQCRYARALGYRALEVAPYTLAEDPVGIDEARARALGRAARDEGIAICGLHWLLVAPRGLSITTPDDALRMRTVDVMRRLCELAAWLGADYLVHGSPAQRAIAPGQAPEDAMARAVDSWHRAGEAAGALGLVYCIEPLAREQTRVLNTLAQAARIVHDARLPGLRTMLDTSSAGLTEDEPLPELIGRHVPDGTIAHVQLNDRNRRGPGQGDDRFAPVLRALARHGYRGWLAMEPFEYVPDARGSAAHAAGYVRGLLEAITTPA